MQLELMRHNLYTEKEESNNLLKIVFHLSELLFLSAIAGLMSVLAGVWLVTAIIDFSVMAAGVSFLTAYVGHFYFTETMSIATKLGSRLEQGKFISLALDEEPPAKNMTRFLTPKNEELPKEWYSFKRKLEKTKPLFCEELENIKARFPTNSSIDNYLEAVSTAMRSLNQSETETTKQGEDTK